MGSYLFSGYQSRFLTPLLPFTAILAAFFVVRGPQVPNSTSPMAGATVALLLAYSAMHFLYYGVLFAPFYADLDNSLLEIIPAILSSPYAAPPDKETFKLTLNFMKHFGLSLQ